MNLKNHFLEQNKPDTEKRMLQLHEVQEQESWTSGDRSHNAIAIGAGYWGRMGREDGS